MLLQELAHQLPGGGVVPPGLDQHVEDLALGIDGPLQVHLLAADPDEHLVEMLAAVRLRTTRPQPPRDRRTEGENPPPHGLVGDLDPAFREQVLHVPVAEREAEVHPDGTLDDVSRKAVPGVGRSRHAGRLRRPTYQGKRSGVTSPSIRLPAAAIRETLPWASGAEVARRRGRTPGCPGWQ